MNCLKTVLIFIIFISCNNKQIVNSKIENKGSIHFVYYESKVSMDLYNWIGSLPDSIYTKNINNIAVMQNSDVEIKIELLKQLKSFTISESRLGKDTLFLNNCFNDLEYLSIIEPNCIIKNLDSIKIKKLDYFSSQNKSYSFALDLSKINGLDTILIDAPLEDIEIPTNKSYKYLIPCTKNNQIISLRKYYTNVDSIGYCK
jgi:hypothetical protein